MEKKTLILSVLVAVFILLSLFFISKQISFSPADKSQCKTIIENPSASVNLVFFASENKAKEYSDYLLSNYPLNKYKDSFSVYYQDIYQPECEYYKDIALLCYNRELIKQASACPNDYIFVIKDELEKLRSSSYLNLISINANNPKSVILHEFGHAFANLAEEYTPADLPRKSMNCVKNCEDFKGINEGCFQGCSESTYYRSIEQGLMRTLYAKSLGKFNEFLIESKIQKSSGSKITGKAIETENECENNFYYLISANYASGSITINKKEIEKGCSGKSGEGPFSYKILNEDNQQILEDSFNPGIIFTDSQNKKQQVISGQTFNYEGEFYIKIPGLKEAKTLELYDKNQNKKIVSIPVDNIEGRPCKIQ